MKKVFFLLAFLPFFMHHSTIKAQKVYSEQYESNADVKVYVVDYESQAGWKNSSKMYLMY